MENEWDEFAEVWDSLAANYANKVFAEIKKRIDLNGLRVLDFGCGTGLLAERMSPYTKEIVALDSSPKMIAVLRAKHIKSVTAIESPLTQALILDTPSLHKPFDLIVASSVCAFLPNYRETVGLLFALLNVQGIYLQWDWLKENDSSTHGFFPQEVEAVLKTRFSEVSSSVPFRVKGPDGDMPVLMATGHKTK